VITNKPNSLSGGVIYIFHVYRNLCMSVCRWVAGCACVCMRIHM